MRDLFRFVGDIVFDGHPPVRGQIMDVQVSDGSATSNILQFTKPMTPHCPYFYGEIRALSAKSRITVGIAGPYIGVNAQLGKWNRSVGYHNYNGKCYTCHSDTAHTYGETFGVGDTFGVMVTYFGQTMSTVTFLKNGKPVATRYHYEINLEDFLPTITFENGPIDVGIMWPEAVEDIPKFDDTDMLQWMHDEYTIYDQSEELFIFSRPADSAYTISTLQSPEPLQQGFQHFEMTIQEPGPSGISPLIGLATCSPLIPSPTCELMRDLFKWQADGQVLQAKAGSVVGIGTFYDPLEMTCVDFDDKAQQLVLMYITFNKEVVLTQLVIQPEGGFFPLVALTGDCTKVGIDTKTYRMIPENEMAYFRGMYMESFGDVQKAIMADVLKRELRSFMFRKSSALEMKISKDLEDIQPPDMSNTLCPIMLSADKMGVHVIQFCKPLTEENNHFILEVVQLNRNSIVTIGLAYEDFPLNKTHPGMINNTTGWSSRDGRMYCNGDHRGATTGTCYEEGDTVELELMNFNKKWPVALFRRNTQPVGIRHYRVLDPKKMLPTIALCGNGYDIIVNVYWQTKIHRAAESQVFLVKNWIVPYGSEVDERNNIVRVPDHKDTYMLQSPYPFLPHKNFDFFEIELIEDGGTQQTQAGVALSAASFQEPELPKSSIFRRDFISFIPSNAKGSEVLEKGQKLGWGMLIPESEADKEDPLVIVYLVIDKSITQSHVIYQPRGGFYPYVVLPPSVSRVKLTNITFISSHPIDRERQQKLLQEAREVIEKEKALVAEGKDPLSLHIDQSKLTDTGPNKTDLQPKLETPKLVKIEQPESEISESEKEEQAKSETPKLKNAEQLESKISNSEKDEQAKSETPKMAKIVMAATVIEKKRSEMKSSKACVLL